MKSSKKILIVCLLVTGILTIFTTRFYKRRSEYEVISILDSYQARIYNCIQQTYFHVDIAESIINMGYDTLTEEVKETLLQPIVNQYGVRNVSFLPGGIVDYVYPLEGNEEAIGDNILLRPERKMEAELAVKTRETILCGPYELLQGGNGLICRRAIFQTNEAGEEELWGFVAVVLDADKFLQYLELPLVEVYGYKFQLSTEVNGMEEKVVWASKDFHAQKAMYIEINLPNGIWLLGVEEGGNIFYMITFISILLAGICLSMVIYKYFEKKENQLEILNQKLYIDPLTGAYNRKKLLKMTEELSEVPQPCTVFYMDLNDFKEVNDTYGHETGDELLMMFTRRVKQVIRGSDLLIRMGGDEFCLILQGETDEKNIWDFYNRLTGYLSQTMMIHGQEFHVTASMGYAVYPNEGDSLKDIVALADTRMYENKQQEKKNE